MEGTRVYVPDARLVWLPATVVSVESDGKRFHVRVDRVQEQSQSTSESAAAQSDGRHGNMGDDPLTEGVVQEEEDRVVDLRDEGMPESLPLQNSASDLVVKLRAELAEDVDAALVASTLGPTLMAATTSTGASDMCALHYLHEPAIVYNIRERFFARVPYTYTGQIVVAVNPYQWIKPLYAPALQALYTAHPRESLPPHVYATSATAFRNMKTHCMPQSILVSGESGAGKTETVKIMMEHLASISMANADELRNKTAALTGQDAGESGYHHRIVEKVLKSNPLLEAFGNAKTIRNDNSSRFGKFTQLKFNSDYCLVAAECRHYLLEKSRVVAQAPGERNYHIFYQLVAAREARFGFATGEDDPPSFRYLQDETVLLDGQSDAERYQVTCDALATIGVSDDEQEQLFRALCGILRLGQLDFVPQEADKSDSSKPMASLDASGAEQEQIAQQKREIEVCADLLGVEVATLGDKLCSRTVRARQEVYAVPLSALQAGNNRDALAKELYARMFAYLVRVVNKSISGGNIRGQSHQQNSSYLHIDLLDIFGFESFKRNNFEQFCINFANEKLQQKFTLDVFKTVQDEYRDEQVGWEFVTYRDNQDMLDLLENSMGLMALLNEECVRPMGSDVSFTSKIVSLHDSHPRLEKARLSPTQFLLHHYAGPVTYDAEGFVEKNRDSLQSDLLELLATSKNILIAGVFGGNGVSRVVTNSSRRGGSSSAGRYTDTDLDLAAVFAAASSSSNDDARRSTSNINSGGRKTSSFMQETVSYKFKAQLALLMNDISATEVHYVRCIKPNSKKSPHAYEIDAVVNQLRCAGVIEAIRITRAAFPNKMTHEKFLRRFVLMKSDISADADVVAGSSSSSTPAAACEQLVKRLLGSKFASRKEEFGDGEAETPAYVVGRTLIYFGKDVLEYLEQRRTGFVNGCAARIQRKARRWMAKKRLMRLRLTVARLQAIQKRRVQRRTFVEMRQKCVIIQSVWRGVRSRQQAHFRQKTRMAIRLQSWYRTTLALRRYHQFRDAVMKLQARTKTKKQVGKYQALLQEHKEQAVMESEVDLLKQRLEDEKRARMAIEAENSSLQQELDEVRQSTVALPDTELGRGIARRSQTFAATASRGDRDTFVYHDETKLLDDSERMIDYLRKEVTKGRELVAALNQENEALKIENKKVKDAYGAAGASFAALNQHNKQQSKANLRLMSTHAALIKSQEEKMKKYQKQVMDLKEDLKMQRSVYSAELTARVQQQDLLIEMVRLSESYGVPDELTEKMRSMIENSKPLYQNQKLNGSTSSSLPPYMTRHGVSQDHYGRSNRSDTASSIGPVSVSVSQDQQYGAGYSRHNERRATIDSVLMNPPLRRNLVDSGGYHGSGAMTPKSNGYHSDDHGGYPDRQTWVSSGSRTSVFYEEESRHRKSRIGGMFKKMFKKEGHGDQ